MASVDHFRSSYIPGRWNRGEESQIFCLPLPKEHGRRTSDVLPGGRFDDRRSTIRGGGGLRDANYSKSYSTQIISETPEKTKKKNPKKPKIPRKTKKSKITGKIPRKHPKTENRRNEKFAMVALII